MRKEKKQAGRGKKGGRGNQEERPKVTESDFLGAVKEWLTRKRKIELGENRDLRVIVWEVSTESMNQSHEEEGRRERGAREEERTGFVEKCCLGQFLCRSLEDAIFAADWSKSDGDSLGVKEVS